MAILQVNVRPAAGIRQNHRPQRGGQAGDFQTRMQQFYPQFRPAASNRAAVVANVHSSNFHTGRTPHAAPQPSMPQPTWQSIMWTLTPGVTVGRAQLSATQRLRDAGSITASLDAQLLLAHLLGQDRSWLFTHYERELSEDEADAYTNLVARRTAGEPLAYIIGRREFYDVTLAVDSRVLIPRPETEFLVDAVLDIAAERAADSPPLIVADIGTGSGAIALSVAQHVANLRVIATDISADALAVARANAATLGLAQRVEFRQGDLFAPLTERVDLIVANLPYINEADYQELDVDVRDYEPRVALAGGIDGLDSIRRLLHEAADYLLPGGGILLEIGYDQGEAVAELAETLLPAVRTINVEQDYAGLDRVVYIQI